MIRKVIKRNGAEVDFDIEKIVTAVTKANKEAPPDQQLTQNQIRVVAELSEIELDKMQHAPTIEQIQDVVISNIMRQQAYTVSKL